MKSTKVSIPNHIVIQIRPATEKGPPATGAFRKLNFDARFRSNAELIC